MFVFCVYALLYLPIIVLIIFSFNDSSATYQWGGFTLRWFGELFHSSEIWLVLKHSLIVAFSAVALSLLFGLMIVCSLKERLNRIASWFYIPLLVPEIVLAVGFLYLFSFLRVPLGLTTLIVAHTLLGLAFSVPLLHARFVEMNPDVIEASLDLGASKWQTFIRVVLPFLQPAVFSVALLVWMTSFDDFLISFFCTGSASQTLPLYIYARVHAGITPVINALSTFTLLVSFLLVIVYSWLRVKLEEVV
jgi:spermidine/putrescine transport system permease protein